MTATAYTDAIDVHPITIAINAVAWAEPAAAGWFTRCNELNRLLGASTHLLRPPAAHESESIWYAGVAGTSLAAGIERMAFDHETLRDCVVVFPLDTRIYVADVQQGLVREEWVLYIEAFEHHVKTWLEHGRTFTLLTGGGRQSVDMPNAAELPIDIDTEAMTFQHASLALLSAGLVRWRDCFLALAVIVLALVISATLSWWLRTPTIEPLQRVASLVTQDVSPLSYTASSELASLAMLVATHDVALWRDHLATELAYDPANGMLELKAANAEPINASIGQLPTAPEPPPLRPYTIHSYHAKLANHLSSPLWTVTFGDPYPIGLGSELEQHVTVALRSVDESDELPVAAALVDLSERLIQLPIALHRANCIVSDGVFSTCELIFAIRGAAAL